MTRRLLISDAHGVRLEAARPFLHLETPRRWVVAPDRRAADDWVRSSAAEAGALLGVERFGFAQLAHHRARPQLQASGTIALSPLGAESLVARTIHRGLSEGPLAYFGPVVKLPGFPRALAQTLKAVRSFGIEPAALEALGPAGVDLGRWLRLYLDEQFRAQLADPAAIRTLAAVEASPLPGPLLLLDLHPKDPLDEAVIGSWVRAAPQVWATAAASDARAQALYRGLGFEVETLPEPGDSALARARRSVFAAEAQSGAPDDSLILRSAPGEGPECVELARTILWAAEQGLRFDEQAVVLRHVETYQPLLEDALRRAGIPAFYAKGTQRPDPAGRAFLLLLACRSDDLSASRFAEYLSLSEVPELTPTGAPPEKAVPWVEPRKNGQLSFASLEPVVRPAPEARVVHGHLRVPSQWEHLLVDAAVIGGHDRWARRLLGLARELERARDRLPVDDPRRQRLSGDLEALQNLRDFALPVIDKLARLPQSASWGAWLEPLEALATMALKAPEPVLRVLAELRPMSEVGPVTLDEIELALAERLRALREEPDGHRFGKVWVGTPEAVAGRSFRRVYLPGLAEGLFPAKTREDPLLLDADRARLHPGMSAKNQAIEAERRRLHLALGAAAESLIVSYPRLDTAKGRARVPSFYALDLLRAAEGQVPALKAFERRAAELGQLRLGWPAPEDPTQAIDATEFDLALLASVDPSAAPGLGRYLFDEALPVGRAIRSFARRWRLPWSGADGLWLDQSSAQTLLKGERLGARPYSASRLESYASCPYRFFLQGVLRLQPREEPVRIELLDPRTRGRIFAEVQFLLIRRLLDEGIRKVDASTLDRALERARDTLAAVERQERDDLAPAIPAVWARGFEELRADLFGWLRDLATHSDGYELLHAELAFGLEAGGERDPASRPEVAVIFDRFQVRGSVDLVERHPGSGHWRVIDHKTGRVPEPWPLAVGGGTHLQILLYANALEALYPVKVPGGRYSYCTLKTGYTSIELKNDEGNQAELRATLELIDRALERGQLVPAPREGDCRWCDYSSVCGPGAYERAQQKDHRTEAITELIQLRSRR